MNTEISLRFDDNSRPEIPTRTCSSITAGTKQRSAGSSASPAASIFADTACSMLRPLPISTAPPPLPNAPMSVSRNCLFVVEPAMRYRRVMLASDLSSACAAVETTSWPDVASSAASDICRAGVRVGAEAGEGRGSGYWLRGRVRR